MSCAHCGLERLLHFSRWTDAIGWHVYTEPGREQILERLRQRYAAQLMAMRALRRVGS